MGLLIRSCCVISYAKVKRTPHLGFTPAYKALVSAVYWILLNKWEVYCECGLAVRLCVMYSSACIMNAVSPTYYTFTLSKVIVMRITLQSAEFEEYFCKKEYRTYYFLCKKAACYHSARKVQVTERTLKLTLIEASAIYQISSNSLNSLNLCSISGKLELDGILIGRLFFLQKTFEPYMSFVGRQCFQIIKNKIALGGYIPNPSDQNNVFLRSEILLHRL